MFVDVFCGLSVPWPWRSSSHILHVSVDAESDKAVKWAHHEWNNDGKYVHHLPDQQEACGVISQRSFHGSGAVRWDRRLVALETSVAEKSSWQQVAVVEAKTKKHAVDAADKLLASSAYCRFWITGTEKVTYAHGYTENTSRDQSVVSNTNPFFGDINHLRWVGSSGCKADLLSFESHTGMVETVGVERERGDSHKRHAEDQKLSTPETTKISRVQTTSIDVPVLLGSFHDLFY